MSYIILGAGLLTICFLMVWFPLYNRREDRAAWERLVRERELWVAQGCPHIEYDAITGEPGKLVGNPFGCTLTGPRGLECFPDLAHRNAVAETLYRRMGSWDPQVLPEHEPAEKHAGGWRWHVGQSRESKEAGVLR